MANRRFEQYQYSLEKKVVNLFVKVSFGASGAPTLVRGKGIASIVRSSAGKYVITLGLPPTSTDPLKVDTYQALLGVQHQILNTAAPAAPAAYIFNDSVASAGQLTMQFNLSGTATDPASGEMALINIRLSNSGI